MTVPFRVTNNGSANRTLDNLQFSMAAMQKLQDRLSSGKTITKPSDDPPGAVKSMHYRSDITRSKQYARNASDGLGWLGTADTTLTSSLTSVQRVRDLTLQGANGTNGAEARSALAAEIKQLKAGLIGLANTTYAGRSIFSGTADPQGQVPPLDTYSPTGAYNGNTGSVLRSVGPNAAVAVNVDGPSVWGTPGAEDLWNILDGIEAHLTSSDPADQNKLTTSYVSGGVTFEGDLKRLDTARLNIQNRLSEIGARYHRVETMLTRADDNVLTMQGGLAETENADLAGTIVAFQLQSAAYQAALAATAKVIQPSLVDFIR